MTSNASELGDRTGGDDEEEEEEHHPSEENHLEVRFLPEFPGQAEHCLNLVQLERRRGETARAFLCSLFLWGKPCLHGCRKGGEVVAHHDLPKLSPASPALLLSQAGPHSSRRGRHPQLRVLLLHGLRPACCRGQLGPSKGHRGATAGARVAQNVRLADMNIDAAVQDVSDFLHKRYSSADFFFCPRTFFRSLSQAPVPAQALQPHATAHAARAAIWLVAGAAVQRESARTLCSSGSGPPPWHSPCSGSSSNDVAKARCAATERMPLQRCTPAPRGGDSLGPEAPLLHERAPAGGRCAPSRDQRPPTSTPKMTRRHRLGRGLQQAGHPHRPVALRSCRPG